MWIASITMLAVGCATGPLQENPVLVGPQPPLVQENPVYIPLGPHSYGIVFEKVRDVISDYFEIAYSNRYAGQIETFPRVAPGIGQPWKPGSPDLYQRLLATFQSIRHRAIVLIKPAEDGGFFIDVKVYKELEDVAKPSGSGSLTAAVYRADNTVERQYEVIDATTLDSTWIPIGRDCKLEQVILNRLARFDYASGVRKQPCPNPAP
jgi:hypothetical protein